MKIVSAIAVVCLFGTVLVSFRQVILLSSFFQDKTYKNSLDKFRFFWPFINEKALIVSYVKNKEDKKIFDKLMRLRVLSIVLITPFFLFFLGLIFLLIATAS